MLSIKTQTQNINLSAYGDRQIKNNLIVNAAFQIYGERILDLHLLGDQVTN